MSKKPNTYMGKIAKDQKQRIVKLEAQLEAVVGIETPWPIWSILERLCDAADILLDDKDYDGHGWELLHEARERGRQRIDDIKSELAK